MATSCLYLRLFSSALCSGLILVFSFHIHTFADLGNVEGRSNIQTLVFEILDGLY